MRVFITGASGGLGRAMAAECAGRGYDLFLTDINASALEAIRAGITRRYGVKVQTYVCDLTRGCEVEAMFDELDAKNLEFDMLLNVAGVDYEGGFTERTAGQLSTIVEINIEAALNVTHRVLKRRAQGGQFYIIFVSSLASLYPMPLKACYAASKRFLYDFAYALGRELRPEGVSVTVVCPGGLPTTDDAMIGIAAQGFWGTATANRLEIVSRRTISKVLRGRTVYIPGLTNRILSIMSKLLPRAVIVRVVHKRWKSARALRGSVGESRNTERYGSIFSN